MRKRVSTPFSRAYNASTLRGVRRRLKRQQKWPKTRSYKTPVRLGKGCVLVLLACATAIGAAAIAVAFVTAAP